MSSERKDGIKRQIEALVQEYAEIVNVERLVDDISGVNTNEPVYIMGWVLFAEYESPSTAQAESTAQLNIYRPNQARAMSRGLYEHGSDAYRG